MNRTELNESLNSVHFIFKYSWFKRRNKQVYENEININYDSRTGRVIEFAEDLNISGSSDYLLYETITSFLKVHFGLDSRYILKPVDSEGQRHLLIKKKSLNSKLNDYYTSPKPRRKLLCVKDKKLEICWDGFWQNILH